MRFRGRRLFLLQATGVGVALIAIAGVGLWIMPPWWAPWLFGAIWGLAVFWRLHRARPAVNAEPRTMLETRASIAVALALALVGI